MTEFDIKSPLSDPRDHLKIYIDGHKCISCGLCAEICPFGLPAPDPIGKYEIIRTDLCTECSACKRNCPTHAIIMQERKGCGCLWNVKAQAKSKRKTGSSPDSCDCC